MSLSLLLFEYLYSPLCGINLIPEEDLLSLSENFNFLPLCLYDTIPDSVSCSFFYPCLRCVFYLVISDLVPHVLLRLFRYLPLQFVIQFLNILLFEEVMKVDYLIPHICYLDYYDGIHLLWMLLLLPFSGKYNFIFLYRNSFKTCRYFCFSCKLIQSLGLVFGNSL